MAFTRVQSANGGATSGASPSVTLGSTPTVGNLLVASIASGSNATIQGSGWTTIANDNNIGSHVSYKIVGSGQSATLTWSQGTNDWAATVVEYSGNSATPYDVDSHTVQVVNDATGVFTLGPANVTTTAAGDLLVGFVGMRAKKQSGAAPSTATWTGSLTNFQAKSDGSTSTGNTLVACLQGDNLDAGAAGSKSSDPTWTTIRYGQVSLTLVAFKGSAGPSTITGASSLSATAAVAVSARANRKASSSPVAGAAFSVSGVVKKLASASLSSTGTAAAAGGLSLVSSASLSATASIGSVMGHHTAVGGSTANLGVATALLSGSLVDRFAEAGFTAQALLEVDAAVPAYGAAVLAATSGLFHFEYEIFLAVGTAIVADSNTAHVTYGIHQFGLITGDDS